MKKNYLDFIEDHLDKLGKISGLNEKTINKIEANFGFELPQAYRQFLLTFGADSGYFMNGYYMCYPSLFDNKEDAEYELSFDESKKDKIKIEKNMFFFAQWQGYNFFFFRCTPKNDNPEIFLFDTEKITLYKPCFTDFLKYEGLIPLINNC